MASIPTLRRFADTSLPLAPGGREAPLARNVPSSASARAWMVWPGWYRGFSVVSRMETLTCIRTVLKRETGNVTLFAFDQGQGLSEHTAPFDAFAHALATSLHCGLNAPPMASQAFVPGVASETRTML